MYRRSTLIVAIILALIGMVSTYTAAGVETTAQSQSQGSQNGQVSTCSWPPSPSGDRGSCNTCAVACQAGQVAVCTPAVVESDSSACAKQPECTCR